MNANKLAILGALATVLATGLLLLPLVPRQMWFHDEGQYGQSAERILQGELPHRDFHEMYTGALSYFHAAVFSLAGRELISLRYALVIASLPAALAMYDIWWRLTGRVALAALVSISSFVVSVGMTHAASPTLYLSFLTMLVTWMLVRDAARPHWGWILGAGLCAGMGVAIKVTGLYIIAAAALAITYRGDAHPADSGRHVAGRWIEWLLRVCAATFACVAALSLVRAQLSLDVFIYFVVPTILLAIALIRSGLPFRVHAMAIRYAVFGLGTLVPIGALLWPWITAGALPDFVHGVFVLPQVRIHATFYPPPSVVTLVLAIPAVLCFLPVRQPQWMALRWAGLVGIVLMALLGLPEGARTAFRSTAILLVLDPWRWLMPAALPIVAWKLWQTARAQPALATQVFAIFSSAVFMCLNQFPFAQPIYFFFCFPQIALAAMALSCLSTSEPVAGETVQPGIRSGALAGPLAVLTFCAFCLLRFGLDGIFAEFNQRTQGAPQVATLSGIIVPQEAGVQYQELKAIIDAVSSPDQAILAGPDCPEVYFLCGRKNLTPVMYDVFATSSDYESQLLEIVRRDDVAAIVINNAPEFSKPWSPELCRAMAEQCEGGVTVGKFLVLVKHAPAAR